MDTLPIEVNPLLNFVQDIVEPLIIINYVQVFEICIFEINNKLHTPTFIDLLKGRINEYKGYIRVNL